MKFIRLTFYSSGILITILFLCLVVEFNFMNSLTEDLFRLISLIGLLLIFIAIPSIVSSLEKENPPYLALIVYLFGIFWFIGCISISEFYL